MENEIEKVWSSLSLYESTELLKKFHKDKFGREINTGKAYEISAHISQGREYFESAASADTLVKPLLIYYGVLSLSRALILFSNEKNREASLAQSHGLTALNWGKTLSHGVQNIPKIEIKSEGGGTLAQLIEIQTTHEITVDNVKFYLFPYMPIKLSKVSWSKKFTVNLDDLLSRTPELISTYLKVVGQTPKCRQARIALEIDDIVDLSTAGSRAALAIANMGDGSEDVKKYFKLPEIVSTTDDHMFYGKSIRVSSNISEFKLYNSNEMNDLFLSCEGFDYLWNEESSGYLVFNFNNGEKMSKLIRMYCLSYILGMIVRYNPTSWASLVNKRAGDKYFPLLKSSTEILENQYPKLILFHLQGHSII